MPEPLADALARVRDALLDGDHLVRAVAAGRRRGHSVRWRRVELRYVEVKGRRVLQVTTYDQTRARARNLSPGTEAEKAVDEVLDLPFANWHVDTTGEVMQLRVTKKGEGQLHVEPQGTDRAPNRDHDRAPNRDHDRAKPRMLPADDPALRAVGIADDRGRIKPSRQAKYRQVDEFLRILQPAVDDVLASGKVDPPTPERPLRVVDLGCGNAYLTFAAASYLSRERQLPLRMVGVDVRPQARRRNTELATSLGLDDRLTFVESTISDAELPEPPDVVLALHACDTATDQALARAVRWRAPVILAAPCCHHDIQAQLTRANSPEPYPMITRYGILRERLGDVLTDALRTSILRQQGYRVEAIQFVESKHTPRNILLRAFRTGAAPTGDGPTGDARREYDEMVSQWNLRPALARMLDA